MFGEKIKQLRKENNLTQSELANKLNCSLSKIGMWETDRREPTKDDLILLSNVFDVSVDYILGLTNIKKYKANVSDKNIKYIEDTINKLNDIGKKEAIKRISELTEINKYTTLVAPVTMAAHNDNVNKEQLELMNQDLDEL